MGSVTLMNESCQSNEWVMSRIRVAVKQYSLQVPLAYEWVTSHIWMSHVHPINESCQTNEWVMSRMRVAVKQYSSQVPLVTHSYVRHDPLICVTWLIHIQEVPAMNIASQRLSCVTWLTHWIDMTHSFICNNDRRCLLHMNESRHTYEWVTSHIWMSRATHMNESCYTYEWVMAHIRMGSITLMNQSCHTYE